MGYINLSSYIYSSSNIRNINILFTLIMKHYKITFGRMEEININNLYNYFNYNLIWLYDDNLNKKAILYY